MCYHLKIHFANIPLKINLNGFLSIFKSIEIFSMQNCNYKREQYLGHHFIAYQNLIDLDHYFNLYLFSIDYFNFCYNYHFQTFKKLFTELNCPSMSFHLIHLYFAFYLSFNSSIQKLLNFALKYFLSKIFIDNFENQVKKFSPKSNYFSQNQSQKNLIIHTLFFQCPK